MKCVRLTGMSGTGKSAAIRELAARGHTAVDLDDGAWSAWVDAASDPTGALPGRDWLWREVEPRLRAVAEHEADTDAPLDEVAARVLRFAGV